MPRPCSSQFVRVTLNPAFRASTFSEPGCCQGSLWHRAAFPKGALSKASHTLPQSEHLPGDVSSSGRAQLHWAQESSPSSSLLPNAPPSITPPLPPTAAKFQQKHKRQVLVFGFILLRRKTMNRQTLGNQVVKKIHSTFWGNVKSAN